MPSTNPAMPHPSGPHAADYSDPRPHVAAILTLAALGWHVTAIRPDRDALVLWRVTIERFDHHLSISVTEVDPDAALEELIRYVTVDWDCGFDLASDAANNDPRMHVAAIRALKMLGWHVTAIRPEGIAPRMWCVSIDRFDGHMSMSVTEVDPDDALQELLIYAAADLEEPQEPHELWPTTRRGKRARRRKVLRTAGAPADGASKPAGADAAPAERADAAPVEHTPDAPVEGSEEP